jgi:hypothetical protein
VFDREGTFRVSLTIRDARGGSGSAEASISARSLTGHWVDADPRFQIDLVQSGNTFTGDVSVTGFGRVSFVQRGVVQDPRQLSFHRESPNPIFWYTGDYAGTVDATLSRIRVSSVTDPGLTFDLTRQ